MKRTTQPELTSKLTTYLGQQARINKAYKTSDGTQYFALRTICDMLAIDKDITTLIDHAEDRRLQITDIEF